MPSKLVILRVHERWLDDYLQIASDWLTAHGRTDIRHDTRVGYIGGGRFHIIIDIEKEETVPNPVDITRIPMENLPSQERHRWKANVRVLPMMLYRI
jgi:hypothetical protein